jgi:hypothetical protein
MSPAPGSTGSLATRRRLKPVAASAGQPLEALVRDELRGPVSELVRRVVVELVREELNGYAPAPARDQGRTKRERRSPVSTRVCTLCGETKPSSAFNAGRRQCRKCRNARYPATAVPGTPRRPSCRATRSLPVPAATARKRHGYRLQAGIVGRLRDERRALIEAAEVELVERDGRVWQLRRLPSAVTE